MSTNYPTSLDSYVDKTDNEDDVLAAHVNNMQDAIEALQVKVGVDSSAVATAHDYLLTHLPIQVQNWDIGSYKLTAQTFKSDISQGTAPLEVASTTVVTNLNADKVDGYNASDLIEFASGDIMLSTNTSPSSGWTDVSATYNNKFIRISSSTPLATGGSDTHSTPSHVLTIAEMPAHTHSYTHAVMSDGNGNDGGVVSLGSYSTGSTGDGGGHVHASANNIPAYIQLRMFQKD